MFCSFYYDGKIKVLKLSKSLIFKDLGKSAGVRKQFEKKSAPPNVPKEMHASWEPGRQR